MRRSYLSISLNIAEVFFRNSKKKRLQFDLTAKGYLTESQNQLLERDVGYYTEDDFQTAAEK